LDGRRLVDYVQLITVGGYGDGINGNDTDDGEEGAFGLPTFRAAASMVVCDVTSKGHFDLLGGAMAVELAPGKVGVTLLDTVIDGGMNGRHDG
jgi:hypothetical protein